MGRASSSGIGAARDALRQVVALDQFHHRAGATPLASLFEAVDGRDVRMVQRGEDFRFALETARAGRDRQRTRPAGP